LKFQGYHQFLSDHPEFQGKMMFVEFLLRASSGNQDVKQKLLLEAERIKRDFGEASIHLIPVESDNEEQVFTIKEICAWYNASEVAVVSTFWDGLNLFPYEYTAAQSPERPGALIISEFMGCSRSLNGVLRVNPWSLKQVSNAIASALNSTLTERKANHIRRYQYVLNHTLERWASGFLDQLDRATKFGAGLHYVQVGWGEFTSYLHFPFSFPIIFCAIPGCTAGIWLYLVNFRRS
jgi:trehalose-6-phosphate synthase